MRATRANEPEVVVPLPPGVEARLRRLRALAWFLDRSIPVSGNLRVGWDPFLGLIPGVGDWLGAVLSLYVLYEGARIGLGWGVLLRMLLNVAVEAIGGVVPVAGDVFDFLWQANMRNLRLAERNYHPGLKPRSLPRIALFLAFACALVIALFVAAAWVLVWLISQAFG